MPHQSLNSLRHQSTPVPIVRRGGLLLPPTLRQLDLGNLDMTAECCGPVLEQVLALGSKGLRSLQFDDNPLLESHGRKLA